MADGSTTDQGPARVGVSGGRAGWLFVTAILVVVNVIWAGQFIAVKHVEPFLGPFAIAFLPFLLVTPLMMPLLFRRRRHPARRPTAADWVRFGIAGGLGQVVCMAGMTWAGVVGRASNCSILYLLIPVLSAVMASAMLGERLTPLRLVALAVGLAGAVVMSMESLGDADFLASRFMKGNLLMVVGCLGACFYNVACKGLMDTFDDLDILIYTYMTATPVGLAIVLAMEPDAFQRLATLDARGWLAFLFLAIMVLGLSMIMFFAVLKSLPVTVALASTYMTPVFGVILAMLLLGERLTLVNAVGSGLVLAATVVVMRYDAGAAGPPAG